MASRLPETPRPPVGSTVMVTGRPAWQRFTVERYRHDGKAVVVRSWHDGRDAVAIPVHPSNLTVVEPGVSAANALLTERVPYPDLAASPPEDGH